MKFRLLFFYSVSIICAINFTSLFSEYITEDMDIEVKPGGESVVLFIGAICKCFEEGYTVDEIIEIFCKQGLSRDSVEIVMRSFDRILKQDATMKRIPNVIIENKQSEKFYALKSFKEKVKIVVAIATVAIVSVGVFKFYSKISDFFKNLFPKISLPGLKKKTGDDADQLHRPGDEEVQVEQEVPSNTSPPDVQIGPDAESPQLRSQEQQKQKMHKTHVRRARATKYDGIRFVVRTLPTNDYTDRKLEEASNRLKKLLEEHRTSVSDDA